LTPNGLVLLFGFLRLCQFWWKSIEICDRESARRRTHTHWQTQTDFIICPMLYAIAMWQITSQRHSGQTFIQDEYPHPPPSILACTLSTPLYDVSQSYGSRRRLTLPPTGIIQAARFPSLPLPRLFILIDTRQLPFIHYVCGENDPCLFAIFLCRTYDKRCTSTL